MMDVHLYMFMLFLCYMTLVNFSADGGLTATTNGNVQMRPKTSGYVLQKFCRYAIFVLVSV